MSNAKQKARRVLAAHRVRKPAVVACYVHPSEVSAYFMESWDNLRTYDFGHNGHLVSRISMVSSANISGARNDIVKKFLDDFPHADWLWWIDADMVFPPDTLDQLLVNADPDKAPIVGGLCFGISRANNGEAFPTLYQLTKDEETGSAAMVRYLDYDPDTMLQVSATGSACILIHRKVLEAVRDKGYNASYPWYQETELGGKACSEDITFCIRAALLGFPTYVDTGVPIGHHKPQIVDQELFLEQRAKRVNSDD